MYDRTRRIAFEHVPTVMLALILLSWEMGVSLDSIIEEVALAQYYLNDLNTTKDMLN